MTVELALVGLVSLPGGQVLRLIILLTRGERAQAPPCLVAIDADSGGTASTPWGSGVVAAAYAG